MALQGAEIDIDVLGIVGAAIDHAGDQALLTRLIGWALAGALTRFRLKFLNLRHFLDPCRPGKCPFGPGKARLLAEGGGQCNSSPKWSRQADSTSEQGFW